MTLTKSRLVLAFAVAALAAGVVLAIIGLVDIAPGSGGPATPPRAGSDTRFVSGLDAFSFLKIAMMSSGRSRSSGFPIRMEIRRRPIVRPRP